MTTRSVRAVYRAGRLDFTAPERPPQEGAEVLVTFVVEEGPAAEAPALRALRLLRGRGKGEGLVEKLLLEREREQDA